jgi:hypothetical protein
MKDGVNDRRSYCDFFLISLAKRFNTAYYLLLNTAKWSGGETRGRVDVGCVVETRQIVGLRSSHSERFRGWGIEESFPFWKYLPQHFINATEQI